MLAGSRNSERHHDRDRDAIGVDESLIVSTLRRVFRTVARTFVGLVAYDVAARILMQEYVDAAHLKLIRDKNRASQSRIGLLTGIGPEAIRKQLNAPKNAFVQHPITVESRIIEYWHNHQDFMNMNGECPDRLLISGPGRTFQGLINRVTRGLTPKTALESLEARGAVRVVNSHWVELVARTSKPNLTNGRRFQLKALAEAVDSALDASDQEQAT
jgi:hypothetical protein